MMNKFTPTIKGVIAGVLMVLISIAIYFAKGDFDNPLQYISYAVYIGAILWSLYDFEQSDTADKSFKQYFSTGFRCFIVITFIMVIFTYIFTKADPSLKEQMAVKYRAELTGKGNYTAPEIDSMVQNAKDYFNIMLTSMAIFGYLVIGSMATVLGSLFFVRKGR
ncbi:MAG: DUF4199 domain-containing protein [Chitinophagaceae bacterium]|nr:MAG: DUF4199 domain-containing protein [Chitinophagaceae bacterium]